MHQYLERVLDLIDPGVNCIENMTVEEARERVLSGRPEAVHQIEGSFALVTRAGKTVRLARSLDRPMRYFLAKHADGPALIVAERIDQIQAQLAAEGLEAQFHPSYTRMVPAHHVVEIQLVGCPDPEPVLTRFFAPVRGNLKPDLDELGARYINAAAGEISRWLKRVPEKEPLGVCFSGGVDSGAVFLLVYHLMGRLGMNLSRLKAFTLDLGGGPDVTQARRFLEVLGLGLFLEIIEVALETVDVEETLRIVEDYKPLDIEAATMVMALCRGIRGRYPEWKHLADGEGGDENLKDYPIEENAELTVRSVVHNSLLYQEGWGVGKMKHSQTYSGGLSRAYARSYAPARHFGFENFSPFTQPKVVEVAEGIPFVELTQYRHDRLYALKGQIVARGIKAITGLTMPVFEKRRFQHGALPVEELRRRLPAQEREYRQWYMALYR